MVNRSSARSSKPAAMEVLRQFEGRDLRLSGGQVGAIEQVLVHADRAIDLALAAKQAAQRKVQVDRLRIDLDHFDERFDRLVGLLVEQEVQAAEIRQRQRTRFAQQVLDVDARREPAQTEEQRERQQPPESRNPLVAHARYRPSVAVDGSPARAAWHDRGSARVSCRLRRAVRDRAGQQIRPRPRRRTRPEAEGPAASAHGNAVIEPQHDRVRVLQRRAAAVTGRSTSADGSSGR